MIDKEKMMEALIIQALEEHPEGLTTKQIYKIVKKKVKKLKKVLDILTEM